MKSILASLLTLFLLASLHAADVTVEAVVAVDADTKPATTFAPDTPKLVAFFRSTGTEKGVALRGVLIAEDVGDVAPANTKVLESSADADQDNFFGGFTFSKPDHGWPVGKYRVEFYVGDKLVGTTKFSIAK